MDKLITQKRNTPVLLAAGFSLATCYFSPVIAAEGGEHKAPSMSDQAEMVEHDENLFRSDPDYADKPYDHAAQLEIYGGKSAVENPRPMLELGRRIYEDGPLQGTTSSWGEKNPVQHQFAIYGDWRTAYGYNDNGGTELGQLATRLNLDIDYKFTATERLHAFWRPLDQNGQFTRCELNGGDDDEGCTVEFNGRLSAMFFEGDLGAIVSGFSDSYTSWDLPFSFGLMPLLFQNGVWVEDAFTGLAFTLPALNSAALDISNMDITFFAGVDKVTSGGMREADGSLADNDVNLFGITTFIEANGGYWEMGYGYTDGQNNLDDQSYHNVSIAHTRRFGNTLSNSIRVIGNFGQDRTGAAQTADGFVLLVENSLITSKPLTYVPYMNFFAGFDRPQSLARAADAGGVLKNTGINFETDGLTGFPKLDDTANNTWGGAIGVEYLFSLEQQIVVEFATVQVMDDLADRVARGDQYALGVRYQKTLSRSWIFRADAIAADRDDDDNLYGMRMELRKKF